MTELLTRVKSRMFIRANRKVLGLLDGQYASLTRGRSMEFEDLRAYVAGDEVKDIDWKATARHGSPLVRNFSANRQHEVVFVIDSGRNLAALSASGEPKRDLAILVTGVLGFLSLRHGDRTSVLHGNAAGFTRLRPASTEGQLENLLRAVNVAGSLTGPQSDTVGLLRFALQSIKRRSIVVVIADDVQMDPAVEEATRLLQSRHEVLWCTLADAHLVAGVGAGRTMFDVEESWSIPEFLRGNRRLMADFDAAASQRDQASTDALDALGISHVRVASQGTVVTDLLTMLGRRARVRRR